jgi:serine/threonine-protein kinase
MKFGRYTIIKEVGRGSMGVVYQGLDPQIDRLVAVKVLRHDKTSNENVSKRFLKEAKVIGRLSHQNIVTIYDFGEEQGDVYIAMEFLEGEPLSEVMRKGRYATEEIIDIGVRLAETLDYAHRKGVVHRDIKPSNIIVRDDGQMKITDFGIAHIDDPNATLQTQTGEIMGTPAYMSPEQVLGRQVDGRTDIFSLGVILYEMFLGKRPFGGEGKSLMTVFNEIVETTPRGPETEAPPMQQLLFRCIMKALAKKPEDRFQSGNELAAALKECRQDAQRVVETVSASPVPGKKRRSVGTIALVTVLATIGGGIYYASTRLPSPPVPLTTTREPLKSPVAPVAVPDGAGGTAPKGNVVESPVDSHDAGKRESLPAINAKKIEPTPSVKSGKPPPKPVASRTGTDANVPRSGGSDKNSVPKTAPVRARLPEVQVSSPQSVETRTETRIPPSVVSPDAVKKFAFLRIVTNPADARITVNGVYKGTAPLMIKLDLGKYQVKCSRPGYLDNEVQIKLEKMQEYPLSVELKPQD